MYASMKRHEKLYWAELSQWPNLCHYSFYAKNYFIAFWFRPVITVSFFYELLCPEATLLLFSCQHRPPMKKVRKSLALDVMDCQAMPKSKRKSLKTEIKQSIKVIVFGNCFVFAQYSFVKISFIVNAKENCCFSAQYIVIIIQFSFFTLFFVWQEEPVLVTLSSSSFCSKQHESILDQGFLLGPTDSVIFPSTQQPIPASSTFSLGHIVEYI